MKEYHKIQTVFKRDPATKMKTLLMGEYALPEFDYLKHCTWIGTEKVDGTSVRVMWDGSNIKFSGKTNSSQLPVFLLRRLEDVFFADTFVSQFGNGGNVCLYGEGYGNRIQKAGHSYIEDGVDFILFDVNVAGWWLGRDDVIDVARECGVRFVPEVFRGQLNDAVAFVSGGYPSLVSSRPCNAEGLVLFPRVPLYSRSGKRIITKIKHKDFTPPTASPSTPASPVRKGEDTVA